jgi:WD40 repeat protein
MHRHGRLFMSLLLLTTVVSSILALTSQSSALGGLSGYSYDTGWSASGITSPEDATVASKEVAYAYGISGGGRVLDNGNITEFNGPDRVNFTVAASPRGDSASYETGRSMESIKWEISRKINRGNDLVRDKGMELIGKKSGPQQIDQICAIYDFLVDERNWTYVGDWSGLEQFQYSNYTLRKGQDVGGLGKGDCDDFAILLGALVESVGASSRIVFAYGPAGGHAYTEVYLGKALGPGSNADRMIRWLQHEYKVEDINVHTDLSTGDVWLNLDWWKEPGGAKHPGGPLFMAAKHVLVYPDISEPLEPLTPLNEPPIVQFNISNIRPNAGETVTFDASASQDLGGSIESYGWDFGDGEKSQGLEPVIDHVYSIGGSYTVTLKTRDDMGADNSSIQEIGVNNPPVANFTIIPKNPAAGDFVTFDATSSSDAEDGEELLYYWEFDNNSATDIRKIPGRREYAKSGYSWVNLTVKDRNDAKGSKGILLKINEPPLAHFTYEKGDYNIGDEITFKSDSIDADGSIVSYIWDFGDNSALERNQTAKHSYRDAGTKMVNLTVRDNDNAKSSYFEDIYLNIPPSPHFFCEPKEPDPGQTIVFNASESQDPDNGIAKYIWDFGEGREQEVWKIPNAKHTYAERGKYEVVLRVEDDNGAIGTNKSIINVGLGMKLATACYDNTSRIWDVQNGRELHKLSHDATVNWVTFSPDGQKVATASSDNTSRIWDVQNGRELHKLPHDATVNWVTFSPDGQKLATACYDNTSRIWDVQNGHELHKLLHYAAVNRVAFSPDGQRVATASSDNTSRIWDMQTGIVLHTLRHDATVKSVAFSPDGKKVATASLDRTARIWDAQTGLELYTLRHDGPVVSVAFSPDGLRIATASQDETARIWDVETGLEIHKLFHADYVRSVAFSFDGEKVATASFDGTARIWDAQTGLELQKLLHKKFVYSVVFSPDDQKVVTVSDDHKVRIWDARTGQELQELSARGISAVFSPAI